MSNPALTPNPIRLNTSIPGFTFFVEDQALTADQLNQVVLYLDSQQRLSRVWLVGTGIVCGLRLSFSQDNTELSLGAGCAISSDGDLMALSHDLLLDHIRPFEDIEANYSPFQEVAPILELIPESRIEEDDGSKTLSAQSLNDKVLVLYLESYIKAPDFCTDENCDNQGKNQHNNLRVLALPKSQIAELPFPICHIASDLPEFHAARPRIQDGGVKKLEGDSGLQSKFTAAIETSYSDFVEAMEQVKKFTDALAPAMDGSDFAWLNQLLHDLKPNQEIPRLQDIHAFYRDLGVAYMEWRDSLHCHERQCVPNVGAHPKHILLGTNTNTTDCESYSYRHGFYKARAGTPCETEIQRSKLLWRRLREMTLRFAKARTQSTALPTIRLTPSKNHASALGDRPIPAYYGDISFTWNVDAQLRCDLRPPPSYFRPSEKALASWPPDRDFIRIEGHVGQPVDTVVEQLEKLRKEYNIPFKVLTIQIEDDPEFVIRPKIRFLDLETAFYDQRTRLKLSLRDIDDFTSRLQFALDEGADKLPEDLKDKSEQPALPFTRDAAGQARARSKSALEIIPSTPKDIFSAESLQFTRAYSDTVSQGHKINRNISAFAQETLYSPIDRLIQPDLSANWKILVDRFKKRDRKVAELSTFDKFLKEHPGLEHLGGTYWGGTFVLIYSKNSNSRNRVVKADFALPYFAAIDVTQVEEEEPPVEPEDNFPGFDFDFEIPKWSENYNWNITPVTPLAMGNLINTGIQTKVDGDITRLINDRTSEFEVTIQDKLNSDFAAKSQELTNILDSKVAVVSTQIEGLNADLTSSSENLKQFVDGRVSSFESLLDSKVGGVEAVFNEKVSGIESKFELQVSSVDGAFTAKVAGIEEKLNSKVDQSALNESVGAKVAEQVDRNFGVFKDISNIVKTTDNRIPSDTVRVGASGLPSTGSPIGSNEIDPELLEIERVIRNNNEEKAEIQRLVNLDLASSDDNERLKRLEMKNAELHQRGFAHIADQERKAQEAGRSAPTHSKHHDYFTESAVKQVIDQETDEGRDQLKNVIHSNSGLGAVKRSRAAKNLRLLE